MAAFFRSVAWVRGKACSVIMLSLAISFIPYEDTRVAFHKYERYIKHSLAVCTKRVKTKMKTDDNISDR